MRKQYSGDGRSFRVYEFGETRRFVKLVSWSTGAQMVRHGTAEAELEWDGETPCFRMKFAVNVVKPRRRGLNVVDDVPLSQPSCVAFSRNEVAAVAGRCFKGGRSRTARLNEVQKAERVKRIYDATGLKVRMEDLVECATDKAQVWLGYKESDAA